MTSIDFPPRLRSQCELSDCGRAWLARLPALVRERLERWNLTLLGSIGSDATCSWVALVRQSSGADAVLKLALPHFEARDELAGLRFWSGDPTVRLLDADDEAGAMLLERCEPGTALSLLPDGEQDAVISLLLKRLWRPPSPEFGFRPLSDLIQHWFSTADPRAVRVDQGLTRSARAVADTLLRSTPAAAMLATDLHAGNVLRAQREPWLVIDPKPFVGDPAYDATQHLLNRFARPQPDPLGTIRAFADRLEVSAERVASWTFVRATLHSDDTFGDTAALARLLAP